MLGEEANTFSDSTADHVGGMTQKDGASRDGRTLFFGFLIKPFFFPVVLFISLSAQENNIEHYTNTRLQLFW